MDFLGRWIERGCEEEDDERISKYGCVIFMVLNIWVKLDRGNIGCLFYFSCGEEL